MSARFKNNAKFAIQVNSDDNEQTSEKIYSIPTIKSVKNIHQLKKNNLGYFPAHFHNQKIHKENKIKILEKQKAELLQSLQILKNGAVSAIQEKDQIINKLRKLFNERNNEQNQDQDDSKAQQLQNLLQYISDLQYDRCQLKKEIQNQRRRFIEQIQQRQHVIQKLTYQLNWSVQRIESLEKYDSLLQQKIKVIQQSNTQLTIKLNESQQIIKEQKRKSINQSELQKNKSSSSILHCSDSEGGNSSVFLKSSRQSRTNHYLSDNEAYLNISKSLDQYVVQSKIQQLNRQHQIQIQDLTDFYESRIESLKKICQQFPQQTFIKTTSNTCPQKYDINLVGETDMQSNYSDVSFSNKGQQKQKTKQQQRYQRNLRKNLSLKSFKSSSVLRMDPIDQKEEMDLPQKSLKRQLSSFNQNNQAHRSISEISLGNKSQERNYQNESQSSYKYFKYPRSNFKKYLNKSKGKVSNQQWNTIDIPEQFHQINKSIIESEKIKNSKIDNKQQLWNKLFWFTSGTITGGLILTIGHKLFKV